MIVSFYISTHKVLPNVYEAINLIYLLYHGHRDPAKTQVLPEWASTNHEIGQLTDLVGVNLSNHPSIPSAKSHISSNKKLRFFFHVY